MARTKPFRSGVWASQATFGPNASTAVAFQALQEALTQNSGPIDIVAYSGGAQAFTTAYGELTAAQQARIGHILYISPGAGGQLAGTAVATNTTVVTGTGGADVAATGFMTIPFGANQIETSCSHTDLSCLFKAAQAQLSQFAKDGPCTNQDIFVLPFPRNGITLGGSRGGALPNIIMSPSTGDAYKVRSPEE